MIVPVILAAGESRRMGSPKALLDFGGTTCLEAVLRSCQGAAAGKVIVVVGHQAPLVHARVHFTWVKVVENAEYRLGQTSSLQCGLRALPKGAAGFLLWPVDLPLVSGATVRAILSAWRSRLPGKRIAVPLHGARRGHPALFDAALAGEFLALDAGEPAHAVLRRDLGRVLEVAVDDPWCVAPMDTQEEYELALAEHRRRGGKP